MPRVRVNDIDLEYQWHAASPDVADGALPLVVIHGFAANTAEWHRFVIEARHRGAVLTYTLRGHAGSGAGPHPPGTQLSDLTADLIGLLDHLAIERAHLLGHSLGGLIALDCVLRHPARAGALILLSTTPEPAPKEQRAPMRRLLDAGGGLTLSPDPARADNGRPDRHIVEREAAARASSLHSAEIVSAPPGAAALTPHSASLPSAAGLLSAAAGAGVRTPHSMDAGYALLERPDLTPALTEITVPTLVLVGEREPVPAQRGAELLHGWIPTSRLVRIEGAGHHAHQERPKEFNRLALAFLEEVDRAGGEVVTN